MKAQVKSLCCTHKKKSSRRIISRPDPTSPPHLFSARAQARALTFDFISLGGKFNRFEKFRMSPRKASERSSRNFGN